MPQAAAADRRGCRCYRSTRYDSSGQSGLRQLNSLPQPPAYARAAPACMPSASPEAASTAKNQNSQSECDPAGSPHSASANCEKYARIETRRSAAPVRAQPVTPRAPAVTENGLAQQLLRDHSPSSPHPAQYAKPESLESTQTGGR